MLFLVEEFSSSREQPLSLWRSLLAVMSSMTTLIPGARLRMRSLQLRLNVAGPQLAEHALISWGDSCHQDLRWWSDASHLVGGVSLDLPQPLLLLFTDASDSGWGALLSLLEDQLSGLWTPDISHFSTNHRELLAVFLAVRGFLVHGQHLSSGLPAQGRGYLLGHPQLRGSVHPSLLRVQRCTSATPVCSWDSQRLGRFPQSRFPSLGLRVDPLPRGMPEAFPSLAGQHRPIGHLHESLSAGLLLLDGGSSSDGDRRMRQCWDGIQAYAFPPFGFLPNVLAKVRQSWNLEATLVAPFWPLKPCFPDVLELLVDVLVLLPMRKDLLSQPHFHHFHRNLPALHMTGFHIASDQRAISDSLRE